MKTKSRIVTMAILAYNQEKFIKEALESALAQSYSPLQIVITDDCSSDHTFDIIKDTISTYQGSHDIIINRNPKNIGIGGQINKVADLAKGDLIVFAAGDDISCPWRIHTVFKTWQKAGFPRCVIYSSVEEISEEGQHLSISKVDKNQFSGLTSTFFISGPSITGSSECIHQHILRLFNILPNSLVNEDGAFLFRAMLLDGVLVVDEPLVKHRHHNHNAGSSGLHAASSHTAWAAAMKKAINNQIVLKEVHLNDLNFYRSLIDRDDRNTGVLLKTESMIRNGLATTRFHNGLLERAGLDKFIFVLMNLRFTLSSPMLVAKLLAPKIYWHARSCSNSIKHYAKSILQVCNY